MLLLHLHSRRIGTERPSQAKNIFVFHNEPKPTKKDHINLCTRRPCLWRSHDDPIVLTLEHLKERVSNGSLVEKRCLKSENVIMMNFSTTYIEVLCEKCRVFFLDYDVLKDCYMKDSVKFVHA